MGRAQKYLLGNYYDKHGNILTLGYELVCSVQSRHKLSLQTLSPLHRLGIVTT